MSRPDNISTYLKLYSPQLGERIVQQFPPLHAPDAPLSPLVRTLLRKPYPAQSSVLMGLVKFWQQGSRNAIVVTFSKSWPKRSHFGLTGCGHFMV